MIVKCINAKNFNLTQDQEYEVVDSRVGFYLIMNDAGLRLPYSTKLFEKVATNPTKDEIIQNIKSTSRNVTCQINDKVLFEYRHVGDYDLEGSSISCGIKELSGINNLAYNMFDYIGESISFLTAEEKLEVFAAIFRAVIDSIASETTATYMLMSTNATKNNNYNIIEKALEDLDQYYGHNPNSGNYIAFWIYKL